MTDSPWAPYWAASMNEDSWDPSAPLSQPYNTIGWSDINFIPPPVEYVLRSAGILGATSQDYFTRAELSQLLSPFPDLDPLLFLRGLSLGAYATASIVTTGEITRKAAEELVRREAASSAKDFQDGRLPDEWDFAIGSVIGFRKMVLVNDVLKGAFGKPFPAHEEVDERSKARCLSFIPPAGQEMVYRNSHDVPDAKCSCGWWSYWSVDDARRHPIVTTASGEVIVAVEGTGRTIIGQRGWRSEYLRLIAVSGGQITEDYFARKYPGLPVYNSCEELIRNTTVDPNYGKIAQRYPELDSHDTQSLQIYTRFLMRVLRDIQERVAEEAERVTARRRAIYYSSPMFSGSGYVFPDVFSDWEYHRLVQAESGIAQDMRVVMTLIAERG